MKKKQLTLKDYEAHIASMCVAIVSGGIGGLIVSGLTVIGLHLNSGFLGFLGAAIWGWWASWLVCKYLFPSAHHWYGHGSWSHRIYDLVGIAGGVLVYWLLR